MKRLASLFAVILALGIGFAAPDAEAKRFGGGMSSGMKRDSGVMRRDATPTPPAQQNVAQAQRPGQPGAQPQPSGMSRWMGPLAGLAAGIGLAALFSHLGLGEGMASLMMMLLIGAAIFFVVRMLMRRNAPQPQVATQYAGGAANAPLGTPPRIEPGFSAPAGGAMAAPVAAAASIPAGFDAEGFLRQAKLNYIRLQAANDAGNMEDIRAFTAPEMFAEIQMQHRERGQARQETDVMQLNAALLDVTSEAGRQVASVHFSGTIRESADGAPEAFDEVWHLTRPADGGGGWIVAGIQQFN